MVINTWEFTNATAVAYDNLSGKGSRLDAIERVSSVESPLQITATLSFDDYMRRRDAASARSSSVGPQWGMVATPIARGR
jgi:hypothetical protein